MKYIRPILFYMMLVLGLMAFIKGFILYLWPRGPQPDRIGFMVYEKTFE